MCVGGGEGLGGRARREGWACKDLRSLQVEIFPSNLCETLAKIQITEREHKKNQQKRTHQVKAKDLSKQNKPKNSEEIVVVSRNHTQYGYKVHYTKCIVG
jgi:hypothetical protein